MMGRKRQWSWCQMNRWRVVMGNFIAKVCDEKSDSLSGRAKRIVCPNCHPITLKACMIGNI